MSSQFLNNRAKLGCEALEAREVPAAFPIPADAVAISPDDGGIPTVHLVSPLTGQSYGTVAAYESAFRGGVHAALGDLTGDGIRDLVISPGRGGGPRIRIIDGANGETLRDFFIYEPTFTGGVYVALGDINGDDLNDLVCGTGVGGGPRVRVLDGASLGETVLRDFNAYEDSFRGGVLVASGDTNGDGRDDVLCGTGVGGGPRVLSFSGTDGSLLRNEFAYEDSFRGGVLIGSGDTNGDGSDDLICGTGPGGGPVVRVLSGSDGRELAALFADDSAFRGGVRVDARDLDGDGRDDVIAHLRHGNDDGFRAFSGDDGSFLAGVSRVVDDNPSARDILEGRSSGIISGAVSYVEGSFISADVAAGTALIRLRNGSTVTVQAGAGTEIKRDKAYVTLAAFQTGDKVEALIGANGIAWEIEAKSPAFIEGRSGHDHTDDSDDDFEYEGTVASVDAVAGTVSIRLSNGSTVTVQTGVGTKIERNDQHTTLASFVVGDRVETEIGSNGIALEIEAVGAGTGSPSLPPVPPPAGGTSNAPAGSKIEGVVTAVDVAAGRVSIRVGNATTFSVWVSAATRIERNDNHTSLSAFQVGDFGEAEIGADGYAVKIEAVQI